MAHLRGAQNVSGSVTYLKYAPSPLATCAPRICTVLRGHFGEQDIKGAPKSALLRFRERPRTIKVQRTTSSPQNHHKSLAQYYMVLLI